jgi:hypothetical protein
VGTDLVACCGETGGVGAIWFAGGGLLEQPSAKARKTVKIDRDMRIHDTGAPRSLSRSRPGRPM